MKLVSLITVIFSARAVCQNISREAVGEDYMKEVLAELQQNIKLDENNLPRYRKSIREPACGGITDGLWSPFCWNMDFVENLQLVRHNGSLGTMSMSVKSQINMDSTTTGWNIGADANFGTWNPINGMNKGISVSGSYSSSSTTSKSMSVSFSSSLTCPPMHTCWTEAWTVYLTVTGYCKSDPRINICGRSLSPCQGPLRTSRQCSQVTQWRDKVCKPEEFQRCTVTTPVMDGKLPYFEEVFFEKEMTKRSKTEEEDSRGESGSEGRKDPKGGTKDGIRIGGWLFEDGVDDAKVDEKHGGKDGAGREEVRATGFSRNGWCQLSDGWIYNIKNDTYGDTIGEAKWVKFPGRKKPADLEKECGSESKAMWKEIWDEINREEEEKDRKGNRTEYVFRGDSRSPDQIRNATGFLPRRNTNYDDPITFSLYHHALGIRSSTAYVSTSSSFGQSAANFAGSGNWVYRIHITPNMISVNQALSPLSPYPQQEEAAALGGIPWNAVQGWWHIPVPPDDAPQSIFDQFCLNDVAANALTERYETEYEHLFTANPDYEAERYNGAVVQTRDNIDVAVLANTNPDSVTLGLQPAASHFMWRHGSTVGWTPGQSFPLWEPVPSSADSTPRRYPMSPMSDDDLRAVAQVLHEANDTCLEGTLPSPAAGTILADLGDDLASLRQRASSSGETDEEEQRTLQEAEGRLRRTVSACVLLTACASMEYQSPPASGRRRRSLVRLTPGLDTFCRKLSGLKPWYYGGDTDKMRPAECQSGFERNVPFVSHCERVVGTEVYCNRVEDEEACLSKREPPPFLAAKTEECEPMQDFFKTEDCVGTERWCSEDADNLRTTSSKVTTAECLLRRLNEEQLERVRLRLRQHQEQRARQERQKQQQQQQEQDDSDDDGADEALPCSRVDDLKVDFWISEDGILSEAGTYDTIVLSLGWLQTILAEAPSQGGSFSQNVNLQRAFGTKAVPLGHIKQVKLLDLRINDPNGGDRWHFQGLTLRASCVGSSKALEVNKFKQVNTWLQHGPGITLEEVWSGDIQPQDWLVSEPESSSESTRQPDELRKFVDGDDDGMQNDGNAGSSTDWTEIEMPLDDDDDDDRESSKVIDCKASQISWDFFDRLAAKVARGELACHHPSRGRQATMRWWRGINLERCEVVENGQRRCSSWPASKGLPDSVIEEAAEYGIPTTMPPPRTDGKEMIDCLKAGISWDKKNRDTRRIVSGIDSCGRRDRPGQTWTWWLGRNLIECRNKGKDCQVHQPATMTDDVKRRAREFGIPIEMPPSEEQDRELWRGPSWGRLDCRGIDWKDGNERTRLLASGKGACVRSDDRNWLWRWKGGRRLVECKIKPISKEYRCFHHDPGNLTAEVKARADRFYIPTTIPPADLIK
ncbi:hypothetical protein CP532_0513 [Ophiocordyceps camponoti-leonardi (nom. inval.)]|nr:hypothetical protein CP532_0513 [Ophiocordyceps camponoti-leonardi (nom. inval.)]